MHILAILEFAAKALGYINTAASAGKDITLFAKESYDALQKMREEHRGPTDAENAALDKTIADLRAELHT